MAFLPMAVVEGSAGCANVRSGHSRSGVTPSLLLIAASMRRDRQLPRETEATVEACTPSSRAICDRELPARRSSILMRSCRLISRRKALPSTPILGLRVVQYWVLPQAPSTNS